MIQIFLNNKGAIPRKGTSIKIISENPFFTKSASYTMEIELPLDIPENREIFGWMDRIDETKDALTFDARLIVDNDVAILGIATVVSSDDEAVKIQIMGEASAYNYRNKLDEAYIDEIDLGNWSELFPTVEIRGEQRKAFLPPTSVNGTTYGKLNEFVTYPVFNSSSQALLNGVTYERKNGTYEMQMGHNYSADGDRFYYNEYLIAIQPFIWAIAKRVAKATGYTLANSDNALYTDELLSKIFMVNANNFYTVANSMPHWSVNEFWTNIENAFGVATAINYSTKEIKIKKRSEYFSRYSEIVELDNIEDSFSVEMNDESQYDISTANVGFASHESGAEDELSEYIHSNAETKDGFSNLNDLANWALSNTPDFDKIYKCDDGRYFIYSQHVNNSLGFIEVDMLRPRISNDKDNVEIELKFVPAKYIDYECYIQEYVQGSGSGMSRPHATTYRNIVGQFPIKVLSAPNISDLIGSAEYESQINIDAILNEGDEERESSKKDSEIPDNIYIAIENGEHPRTASVTINGTSASVQWPYPLLRERAQCRNGANPELIDAPYSLSINRIDGQKNLAAATLTNSAKFDTKVKHCVKFLSSSIPNADAVFLIRNKKFVCEKIEANASDEGLNELMTGYFYEIDI